MAVPSYVGTCGMVTMVCNEVLKPTMLLAGGIVVVLSAILLVLVERRGIPLSRGLLKSDEIRGPHPSSSAADDDSPDLIVSSS